MVRRPVFPLLAALAGTVAFVGLYLLAFRVDRFATGDRAVFDGFHGLQDRLGGPAEVLASLGDPQPFAILGFILICIAILRGRARVGVAVAAALMLANVTTQILKPALSETTRTITATYPGGAAIGFPSGHATASMSLALCAILVVPPLLRPAVAACGAAYSLLVCFSLLILGWHLPSEVIGGFLVAGSWTALAVAVVWAWDARRPPERSTAGPGRRPGPLESLAPAAAVLFFGGLFALLAAITRPAEVTAYARDHTAFMVGATIIAVVGLALVALFSAGMSGSSRRAATGSGPAPTAAPRRRWPRATG